MSSEIRGKNTTFFLIIKEWKKILKMSYFWKTASLMTMRTYAP
jgi:hypothetical protein